MAMCKCARLHKALVGYDDFWNEAPERRFSSEAYDCRSAKIALKTGPAGPVSNVIFALRQT